MLIYDIRPPEEYEKQIADNNSQQGPIYQRIIDLRPFDKIFLSSEYSRPIIITTKDFGPGEIYKTKN